MPRTFDVVLAQPAGSVTRRVSGFVSVASAWERLTTEIWQQPIGSQGFVVPHTRLSPDPKKIGSRFGLDETGIAIRDGDTVATYRVGHEAGVLSLDRARSTVFQRAI